MLDNESYKLTKVNKPTSVAVVGGGCAGLEAACTAAEVGCAVTLYEKNDHLGGILYDAGKLPAKFRIQEYAQRCAARAERVGVNIQLNTEATDEMLASGGYDLVVNATGSVSKLPPIPGLRELADKPNSNVYTIIGFTQHLEELAERMEDKNVVVMGAGAVGLDVVEHLVEYGAHVTLVDMLPTAGAALDLITKLQMDEILQQYHVDTYFSTAVAAVASDHVQVRLPDGTEKTIPMEFGVCAMGMDSVPGPIANLAESRIPTLNIGDSVRPRRIIDAVLEGRSILHIRPSRAQDGATQRVNRHLNPVASTLAPVSLMEAHPESNETAQPRG